jgi:uncharacterized protein
MPNDLAQSPSPYLRQHADNPVNWVEWSEDAFVRARIEQKPVFLSIGYSSCHWCHVMAHESFEDPEVAAILNANFICVKVDREERPDVDEVYMTAVQVSTGRGGWPMTVFLTPDKRPFFAGTYFPKEDREGYPGFLTLSKQIAQGWTSSRDEFEGAAAEFSQALKQLRERTAPAGQIPLGGELLFHGLNSLFETFDAEFGGFGEAPKFPPHTAIELLLTLMESSGEEADPLAESSRQLATVTLDAMARNGIFDLVGGGFHRYSTDREWHLPHFEKMLGDNAMMLANYAVAAYSLQKVEPERAALYRSVVEQTVRWVAREMTSPQGFFYSALDADSEGEEGLFYTWPFEELAAEVGEPMARELGALPEGNFSDEATGQSTGRNILHRQSGIAVKSEVLERLLEVRAKRTRPGLDYKALASWNGLMIHGLVLSGALPLAAQAAEAWVRAITENKGELPHQVVEGKPYGAAYAEDFAAMAFGFITLADAVDEELAKRYLAIAGNFTQKLVERFMDRSRGGFFATTEGHENSFGKSKSVTDSPMPSTNALAARVLLRLGEHGPARQTLEATKGWVEALPHATEALQLALLELMQVEGFVSGVTSPAEPEAAPATIPMAKVEARIGLQELKFENGVASGEVVLSIPEEWHVNGANPPARWMVPTEIRIEPLKFAVSYPEGDIYTGELRIPFQVLSPGEFEVVVRYQACTLTECLEPVERRFDAIAR